MNYPETLGSDTSLLAPRHLILCSIVHHFVLDGGSFCAPQFLILCFGVVSSSLKFDAVEPKILHARVHYYIVRDRNLDFRGRKGWVRTDLLFGVSRAGRLLGEIDKSVRIIEFTLTATKRMMERFPKVQMRKSSTITRY